MARKKQLPVELSKNKRELLDITYDNFDDFKQKYILNAKNICENTDFLELKCNKSIWVENNIMKPMEYYLQRKSHNVGFSEEDLSKTLTLVEELTNIVNERTRYQPTILTYCRMLCVSHTTFSKWIYENNERGEQARLIQDYFKSLLTQNLISDEIQPASGAFIGKTLLGMRENDGQNMNINIFGGDVSFEDIMAEYEKNIK